MNSYRFKRNNYFLFAGGSNLAGTLGYVNAAFELKQQINNGEMPCPEVIVCPVGSSSTLAGLTLGCQLAGLKTKVVGIRVAPSHLGPFPACTPTTVYTLVKETHRYLEQQLSNSIPKPQQPILIDDYTVPSKGC